MTGVIVSFDTSALNRLLDDGDSQAIVAGLTAGLRMRLTALSIDEVVANTNPARRGLLLNLCRRLLTNGDCIQPHHYIIKSLTRSHAFDPQHFDWRTVDMTHREYENEIARQEFVNDELARKQLAHLRSRQEQFEAIFAKLRSHFDNSFASGDQRPGNFHEFVEMCQAKNAAFWDRAKVAYQQWGAIIPDVETLQLFTQACPPFHAFLVATYIADYERCVRSLKTGPSYRAGRFDLLMSVYLPYCSVFVTDDECQERCLLEVSNECGLSTTIYSYTYWKAEIFL